MTNNFPRCFDFTVGVEGGYTDNPADAGNWTGGVCGIGRLLGTKYGISAAAYPDLDIPNLTLDQASAIYRANYWDKLQADSLPLALAYVAFDAAVNSGLARSIMWLQAAAGVKDDAYMGPVTMTALGAGDAGKIAQDALARRLVFLSGMLTWQNFGLGWTRRVIALASVVSGSSN